MKETWISAKCYIPYMYLYVGGCHVCNFVIELELARRCLLPLTGLGFWAVIRGDLLVSLVWDSEIHIVEDPYLYSRRSCCPLPRGICAFYMLMTDGVSKGSAFCFMLKSFFFYAALIYSVNLFSQGKTSLTIFCRLPL